MKVIHLARFCLIDKGDDAETLRHGLSRLPIGSAHIIAPEAQCFEHAKALAPDVVIVNGEMLPDAMKIGLIEIFRLSLAEDGHESGNCPVILLKRMPRRADVYAAAMAGYSAIMPLPTNSRAIYRRTAALLQKTRRAQRRVSDSGSALEAN